MINKLLSHLPFNPGLIAYVSFYTKRLKQEQSVRRLGLVFIVFSMLLQFFIALSPPEKSLAYSENNIINGLKTRSDLIAAWEKPGSDIPAIYGHFGVTLEDIKNLSKTPDVTIRSDAANYWTIGRLSLTGFSDVKEKFKRSEMAIDVGPSTVYMRQLRAWDIVNPYNTYKAWKGKKKSDGKTFWILVDCGNYVQIDKFDEPEKPELAIKKTVLNDLDRIKPGEQFKYRLEYRNKIKNSLAENVVLEDNLDLAKFDLVAPKGQTIHGNKLRIELGSLSYSKAYKVIDLTLKAKSDLSNGQQICNSALLKSSNAKTVTAGGGSGTCIEIFTPCPFNPDIPNDGDGCKAPVAACSLTETVFNGAREVSFTTKVKATNSDQIKINSYSYDFGDNETKTFNSTSLTHTLKHSYKSTGSYDVRVSVNYSVKGVEGSSKSAACTSRIEITEEPDDDITIGQAKSVKNITRKFDEDDTFKHALGPGEVIEFSLITSNTSRTERTGYVIEDYIGDILDYAVLDTSFLAEQGGSFDTETKKVRWLNQTLKPSADTVKVFRVSMKDPVPSTNRPNGATTSFDCKISNDYGNELSLDVSCPFVKNIERLPNTGPGQTIAFAFTLSTGAAYFFARSRLLAKELEIVKHEYAAGGKW